MKKILVLFPKDWDLYELSKPRYRDAYRFYFEGFDVHRFPDNLRLLTFDAPRWIDRLVDKYHAIGIDGVVSNNEHFGALIAAVLADRLGLPGTQPRAVALAQHKFSRVAAHSAACADEQGKFWEQHRAIYVGQPDWSFKRDAAGIFRDYAKQNGLDLGRYDACMQSARYAGRIQASLEEGMKAGVQATPTFLVGGRLYSGVQTYDALKAIIDSLAPPAGR